MKRIKEEKGITLVALIITIVVVLLILAAVAIGTVKDSDIIGYAQNAASGYNEEKAVEENRLGNYIKVIEENMPKREDEGISIDKIMNKAYAAYADSGNDFVYHCMQKDGKTYINVAAYDINTGEDATDEYEGGGLYEINLTTEFEKITIYVNGSKTEISPENAFLIKEFNIYITEDAMYFRIEEGKSYTAPNSEGILVRNSDYDSKINS